MQYDEAFTAAGKLGKAQCIVIALTYLMALYTGWQAVIPVFVAVSVPFKCVETSLEPNATTLIATSLSFDSKCEDNCRKYAYASSPSSIISTFDLACGTKNQLLAALSNSVFWIGCLVSAFIMGYLGDRFGRRPMNLISIFFYFISSTAGVFSPGIWFYIGSRFLCGFFHESFVLLSFLTMAETIDKKYLAEFGMFTWVWFPLGEAVAPAMGVVFKNSWKHQLMTVSFAIIPVFILYFLIVPESPLWLYSKGKTTKCEEVLRRIANLNNKNPFEIVLTRELKSKWKHRENPLVISRQVTAAYESVIISTENHDTDENQRLINKPEPITTSDKPATVIGLFKTLPASLISIAHISAWFCASLVYYGLTYAAGKIGSNVYLNSFLLAMAEIPAVLLFLLMNYFGRKRTLYVCLLFSAAACVVTPFTRDIANGYFKIVFALIGKCLVAGSFDLLFTYSPEVYPTVLRGTGLLLCSGAARTAIVIAPFVITLNYGPYGCALYLIFGASAILSAILIILWGPETLNKPLINTLEVFYTFAENNINLFTDKKRFNQETSK